MTIDPADVQEMARWALQRFMSDCSEERHCAGWRIDVEYDLWRDVLEAPEAPLPTDGEEDDGSWQADARRLRRLANLAGGWFSYAPHGEGREFVTLDAWARQYAELWAPAHPTRSIEQREAEDAACAREFRERIAELLRQPGMGGTKKKAKKKG